MGEPRWTEGTLPIACLHHSPPQAGPELSIFWPWDWGEISKKDRGGVGHSKESPLPNFPSSEVLGAPSRLQLQAQEPTWRSAMDQVISALSHRGQWIVACVPSQGSCCVYVVL